MVIEPEASGHKMETEREAHGHSENNVRALQHERSSESGFQHVKGTLGDASVPCELADAQSNAPP